MTERRYAHSYATPALTPDADDGWWSQALCAQTGGDFWFPDTGHGMDEATKEAKAICRRCPVRDLCLADALATDERYGIRGALTPLERDKLKKARP